MKSKDGKPGSNPDKISRAGPMCLMFVVLCGFSFYLGGIFSSEKNGFLYSDSIPATVNHKDNALVHVQIEPITFPDCGIDYQDYTPCTDPKRWRRYGNYRLNFMERHCPPISERKECLVPPPAGYKVPIRWPQSKNECWYRNVPYDWINNQKSNQHWLRKDGEKFLFPGGGTMFPNGVSKYVDLMENLIPEMKDGTIRTAIDTGCGMKTPYQRPVTSRCYVTSFRKHCDAFVEIIDDEVEQTLKDLNIHQFLKFPAFQQCIPLLFEILKFWSPADEGFIVLGHVLKFTADEVALLIGMPNRGIDIKWRIDPLNGPLSTEVKTDIATLDRLADNPTKIKTFIMFLLSNLFFPLNSHKTPRRLTTVANNLSEFASINWASSLRNFMVEEFNTIFEKYKLQRPLGYINGFFPLLLIWFLEHFPLNKPTDSELRPRFLRWQGYTELYFTQENAAKLFKFLKNTEIFSCLENVTNEEAEKYGVDIIAIQNSETRSGHEPLKLQSPKKIKASASKKLVTTPPPSPPLSPPLSPDSPQIEPPEPQTVPPPTQPSTRPPTQKISISQPSAEQPPITRADLEAVQNKCFEIFDKMLNKIQENVGARLDRLEDIVEKLQADQDSMKYKFIEFQMQCDHNQEKPHISSSASSFQSVNKTALHPSAEATIKVVPPPSPMVKEIPPPPTQVVPPPSPMVKEIPPPPTQVVPPPIQEVLPPSAKDVPPTKASSSQKRKREHGEKEEISSKKVVPYVKKKTKEVISVDNIIVESHPALEIMDYPGKPFLAEQKQQFMDECFKKFNTK